MAPDLAMRTNKELSAGSPKLLGARVSKDGINFALYSQYASEVFLLLFDAPAQDPTDIIKLENKTDNILHVFVKGLKAGQLYGYKVNGEYAPSKGLRFNPNKLLIDPYAMALSGEFANINNLLFAYDINSPEKDLSFDTRDNSRIVPKCIAVDQDFDWGSDKSPSIPLSDLVIYETHLKGFTAGKSSMVKFPGTYAGFTEKIPYLKGLGINAVEFMPINEFVVRPELMDKGLTDFWGYNTIAFFAPEYSYCAKGTSECQVKEFKKMVMELHKAGIEVIMDVVYNHTGEGNELGPTLSFKGIDNPTYYSLIGKSSEEQYRYYLNDTGCGNTFNIENSIAMRLVIDSLHYWAEVMRVDGFRFDLASILARVHGKFSEYSAFFEAIQASPALNKVKLIAEPWDLTTNAVGNFPKGWSEWNGKFRDTARRFLKGDEGQAADMATRITGSADLYREGGKKPFNSVNFITCHDGFTLNDLFSYNEKHNEANLEGNKDGTDQNFSWNCGAEGKTDKAGVNLLRKRMIKNAFCCLLFSSGTPMILYGDEVMRTQNGNNNVYCQDNELAWFDWNNVKDNAEVLDFFKKCLIYRKEHPSIRLKEFFTGKKHPDEKSRISWFGKDLDQPEWGDPKLKILCYMWSVPKTPETPAHDHFFIFNMNHRGVYIKLPQKKGMRWHRVIDTSRSWRESFRPKNKEKLLRRQNNFYCAARTVAFLVAKP